jgi:hypothetical protein
VDDTPAGIRRLCVAVAAEGFAVCGPEKPRSVRHDVSTALLDACSSAGLDRVLVNAQRTADTEVALLPVGIDEPRAIASLVGSLVEALHRMNAGESGSGWLCTKGSRS